MTGVGVTYNEICKTAFLTQMIFWLFDSESNIFMKYILCKTNGAIIPASHKELVMLLI